MTALEPLNVAPPREKSGMQSDYLKAALKRNSLKILKCVLLRNSNVHAADLLQGADSGLGEGWDAFLPCGSCHALERNHVALQKVEAAAFIIFRRQLRGSASQERQRSEGLVPYG